jgi:hypothetical protein
MHIIHNTTAPHISALCSPSRYVTGCDDEKLTHSFILGSRNDCTNWCVCHRLDTFTLSIFVSVSWAWNGITVIRVIYGYLRYYLAASQECFGVRFEIKKLDWTFPLLTHFPSHILFSLGENLSDGESTIHVFTFQATLVISSLSCMSLNNLLAFFLPHSWILFHIPSLLLRHPNVARTYIVLVVSREIRSILIESTRETGRISAHRLVCFVKRRRRSNIPLRLSLL